MNLFAAATDEVTFTLLGPKPPVPLELWGSPALLVCIAGGLLFIGLLIWAQRSRRTVATPAIVKLETVLADPANDVAAVTLALRRYLAEVDIRAATSLSTAELTTRISALPVFLPARQPLLAALTAADAAKFARSPVELPLLAAGIREAAQRIENARRTFGPASR